MVGSGLGMILSGGGIYTAKTLGLTSLWLTVFNISGLMLAIVGTSITTVQLCRYASREHLHND